MIETKERIFRTAIRLFAKHGCKNVPVRQICEESGISKPVLYHYFTNKETLLNEVAKYLITDNIELVIDILKDDRLDLRTKINKILIYNAERQDEITRDSHYPDIGGSDIVNFAAGLISRQPYLQETVNKQYHEIIGILSGLIKKDQVDQKILGGRLDSISTAEFSLILISGLLTLGTYIPDFDIKTTADKFVLNFFDYVENK